MTWLFAKKPKQLPISARLGDADNLWHLRDDDLITAERVVQMRMNETALDMAPRVVAQSTSAFSIIQMMIRIKGTPRLSKRRVSSPSASRLLRAQC